MRTKIILFFILLLFLALPAYAGDNPFEELVDEAMSFFEPVKGRVASVQGTVIVPDMAQTAGIKKGMRLTVLREGEPYLHPITKEVLGRIETPVGTAEVMESDAPNIRLSILSGEAKEGDTLRLSSARVRVLFYQTPDVSWGLSEEYYNMLNGSERFDLIDTSIYADKDSDLIEEAKKLKADLALVLTQEETPDGTILRQKLLWTEDSKVLLASEARIPEDYVRQLQFGEEFFKPPKRQPFVAFSIPFRVRLIAVGDVNGDGIEEIIMSTGRNVVFYSLGKTLKPALGDIEIKGKWTEEHLWLDAYDINGDKKDEVLITAMRNDRIVSYAYEYKDNEFSLIRKWNFFVRVVGDRLYGQKYRSGDGFKDHVFFVAGEGEGSPVTLPKEVNLYDFMFLESEIGQRFVLAYTEGFYMNLYDLKGKQFWQSKEDYGEPSRKFEKEAPTVMVDRGFWSIKDRMFTIGRTVVVLRHTPFVKMAAGMGYKSSELSGLELKEASIKESTVIDYVPGRAFDFALTRENIIVLSSDIEIKAGNFLKGMGFVGNKLYVYPRRGKLSAVTR